jgi:hypothetical protein
MISACSTRMAISPVRSCACPACRSPLALAAFPAGQAVPGHGVHSRPGNLRGKGARVNGGPARVRLVLPATYRGGVRLRVRRSRRRRARKRAARAGRGRLPGRTPRRVPAFPGAGPEQGFNVA